MQLKNKLVLLSKMKLLTATTTVNITGIIIIIIVNYNWLVSNYYPLLTKTLYNSIGLNTFSTIASSMSVLFSFTSTFLLFIYPMKQENIS